MSHASKSRCTCPDTLNCPHCHHDCEACANQCAAESAHAAPPEPEPGGCWKPVFERLPKPAAAEPVPPEPEHDCRVPKLAKLGRYYSDVCYGMTGGDLIAGPAFRNVSRPGTLYTLEQVVEMLNQADGYAQKEHLGPPQPEPAQPAVAEKHAECGDDHCGFCLPDLIGQCRKCGSNLLADHECLSPPAQPAVEKRYPKVYECGCPTEGGYPFCPEHGADPVWATRAPEPAVDRLTGIAGELAVSSRRLTCVQLQEAIRAALERVVRECADEACRASCGTEYWSQNFGHRLGCGKSTVLAKWGLS